MRSICAGAVRKAQVDGLAGARIDGAEIGLVQFLRTNDVGHDGKNNIVIRSDVVLVAEDVLQNRQRTQSGNAG